MTTSTTSRVSLEKWRAAVEQDVPDDLTNGSHYIAWLLAHGYGITSALGVTIGYSKALVGFVVDVMDNQLGYTVTRNAMQGAQGQPYVFRCTADQYGMPIDPDDRELPPMPSALVEKVKAKRREADAKRKRESRAAAKAKTSTELAVIEHSEPEPPPIPERRLKLLRDALPAPALGTVLRIAMVAETNGHITTALVDERGHTWFADLHAEQHA